MKNILKKNGQKFFYYNLALYLCNNKTEGYYQTHKNLTIMNYARNTYNEMKAQIANINAMINSINADELAEMRNSGEENWTIAQRTSIYTLLPADSIAKIERLGKMIRFNVHQMITFLQVKHYDFNYFSSLI